MIRNLWSLLRLSTDDIVLCVTNLAQRVVREELENRLQPDHHQRPTINHTEISGTKLFKLVFENELPDTIFTQSKIEAKDKTPLKIALYDIRSWCIVTDGPLSSIKIQIYVINSELGSNGREDWNSEEFNAKIIRQRENKGQLLTGETVITLQNGVGYISPIVFTDNSSRTRSRRFKLGAQVVQSTVDDTKIGEGLSKPFVVKDNRGELNQKHYPPSPNDEVWRLKKISKNGKIHERLTSQGINTVKDLLQLHETNPSSLGKIFGNVSTKAIIEHARTCDRSKDNKKLLGDADRNVHGLISVDNGLPSPLATLQSAGQCCAPTLPALDLQTLLQDQLQKRQDHSQPSTSTMHICEAEDDDQIDLEELLSGRCVEGNVLSLLESHIPSIMHDIDSSMNELSDIPFANLQMMLPFPNGPKI